MPLWNPFDQGLDVPNSTCSQHALFERVAMTSKTQDNHSVAINLIQKSSALLHLAWQDGEDFLQEDRGGDGTDGEDGEDADAREEEPVNDVRSRRHGLPYKAASLDVC